MTVYGEKIVVTSNGKRASYHEITNQVKEIIKKSNVKDGIVVVSTPHSTCSVFFEEFVHDFDWNGDEFIQVDMNRILDKLVPRQLTESDYLYPGPKHVKFLEDLAKKDPAYPADPATILNGDAHIRASIFGSSETFVLTDAKLQIGSVGYIYFVDWDQNRVRKRNIFVQIIGE